MFNKKEPQECLITEKDEKCREMLLSLAKELGYEYKSRAVKKKVIGTFSGQGVDYGEVAYLEYYWEKSSKKKQS